MKRYIQYEINPLDYSDDFPYRIIVHIWGNHPTIHNMLIREIHNGIRVVLIRILLEIDKDESEESKQKEESSHTNKLVVISTFQEGIMRTLRRLSFLSAHTLYHSLIIGHLFWSNNWCIILTKKLMHHEERDQEVFKMATEVLC